MTENLNRTGIVHGNVIELDQPTGLADGQHVVVQVRPVAVRPEDGIRASAGAWADAGPEFDQWLADVYAARKSSRRIVDE